MDEKGDQQPRKERSGRITPEKQNMNTKMELQRQKHKAVRQVIIPMGGSKGHTR